MQRNEAEISMYHLQIDCLILNCKIFNFLHFTFLLIMLILNIFLLLSNIPQIVNYSLFNFVAIVLYLIPTLIVGYRLIYIKQKYEQNEHCFSNFIVLLYYLHENDELRIINYLNYISSYTQLLALLYYKINNFPLKSNQGILPQLLQFFNIFYIINIALTSLRLIVYYLNEECRGTCCYGRHIQHYINQKERQQIYNSIIKTTRIFLCLFYLYCIGKFVACIIIFTISDKFFIILTCSSMIGISIVQTVLIYKLFVNTSIIMKSQILMEFNDYCFENYWILIHSLVRSKELVVFQHILFGLYFIQAASAVGIVFQDIDLSFEYYVVLDSYVTFVFMILKLISICLSLCFGNRPNKPIFILHDERGIREYQQKMKEIDQIKRDQDIKQQILKDQQKNEELECCICLQKIQELQPQKQLKCDFGHQFHVQCINQWLSCNSVCPLCQQRVYS